MSAQPESPEETPLDDVLVGNRERWLDGPPNELFAELRSKCPVHWSSEISQFPEEDGFWSVTLADDVHAVSRDWQTYSSERGGITALTNAIIPLELIQAMFIGMDPPKHDRLKALFQRGLHPEADRRARGRDPRDHSRASSTASMAARSATWSRRSPSPSWPA